ncbi:MAG: hypothetical protein EVA36_01620 [Flavobacteriales bacterium]|nr:MAG: hypothetical protein EVA36_01620 [Flavobacteriales bacterium]|tara:strand:- start:4653 stop:5063 length:411 start_codon:yes stop_codon:yes gene_type:complete
MKKISFLIFLLFLNFTYCKINTIDDIKAIEGMWEIYSVSSKGEVFYPQGESPVVDYYTFDSDSTGTKKKLKPNFNKTFSSSFDEINFEIKKNNGLIYLNYITETNNWKEIIKKLTKKELVISNNKFEYHYKRFEIN